MSMALRPVLAERLPFATWSGNADIGLTSVASGWPAEIGRTSARVSDISLETGQSRR
jgi:hypothetical protein